VVGIDTTSVDTDLASGKRCVLARSKA